MISFAGCNNPPRRTKENTNSFTSRYHLTKLVYFDTTESLLEAIEWEKRIKGWSRAKKIALITERSAAADESRYQPLRYDDPS